MGAPARRNFRYGRNMKFDFALFLRALGLALVIEGLLWVLVPGAMRRALRALLESGSAGSTGAGVASVLIGLLVIWLANSAF